MSQPYDTDMSPTIYSELMEHMLNGEVCLEGLPTQAYLGWKDGRVLEGTGQEVGNIMTVVRADDFLMHWPEGTYEWKMESSCDTIVLKSGNLLVGYFVIGYSWPGCTATLHLKAYEPDLNPIPAPWRRKIEPDPSPYKWTLWDRIKWTIWRWLE